MFANAQNNKHTYRYKYTIMSIGILGVLLILYLTISNIMRNTINIVFVFGILLIPLVVYLFYYGFVINPFYFNNDGLSLPKKVSSRGASHISFVPFIDICEITIIKKKENEGEFVYRKYNLKLNTNKIISFDSEDLSSSLSPDEYNDAIISFEKKLLEKRISINEKIVD